MKICIIGGGPVGLTLSHLLSSINIKNTVFERKSSVSTHPSAHFLHSRALEIFSSLGLSSPVYSAMTPAAHWRRFVYCSSLTGQIYREHDHFSSVSYKKNNSLTSYPAAHFPQHKLTSLLSSALPSNSELCLGTEIKSLTQGLPNGKVRLESSDGRAHEADYVVACDGAGSSIREQLGVALDSSEVLQHFMNIHFTSKQLAEACRPRPAMIYFIYNPEAVVVLVMHSAAEAEFVLQVPDHPPLTSPQDYSIDKVRQIVSQCCGPDAAVDDVSVKSIKMWRMANRVADKFRVGNVFIAGDAAHTMTPAGGFGLNTGIGDVHNLYWKFRHPELLDSYEVERKQRVQEVLRKSFENYQVVVNIAKNLGLDVNLLKPVKDFMQMVPYGGFLFQNLIKTGQKVLFNDINAKAYLANDENLLNLFFPEEDLEFSYKSGFFLKGGQLAGSQKVLVNETAVDMRLVPGYLSVEHKKPYFVRFIGKQTVPYLDFPCIDLKSPDDNSSIIRPDGHVYWESKI